MPDVTSKTLTEAKSILQAAGFNVVLRTSSEASTTVVSQTPKSGISLQSGATVFLYTDGVEKAMKKVPDLKGKTAEQAKNSLKALNLNISIEGSGKVISQDILAGQEVVEGTVVTVTLKDEMVGGAQ